METASEVVCQENTKSSVTTKCVQELSSTSVQKLSLLSTSTSTSSMVGENSVLSIVDSDGGGVVGSQMPSFPVVERSVILSSAKTGSFNLPEAGNNAVNTKNVQQEFSAMKLKGEQGNEIGKVVQQRQLEDSVQASSSVTSAVGDNKSSSSVKQVSSSSSNVMQSSASLVLAQTQKSSSSVSSYFYRSTEKKETVSSSTKSFASIKSSQSIEEVKSSTAAVEDQQF